MTRGSHPLAHWRYLRYVLRHKWLVLLAGLRFRVPLWQLVLAVALAMSVAVAVDYWQWLALPDNQRGWLTWLFALRTARRRPENLFLTCDICVITVLESIQDVVVTSPLTTTCCGWEENSMDMSPGGNDRERVRRRHYL